MRQRYKYTIKDIVLPGDLFQGYDTVSMLHDVAINEARERMTTYCNPAQWNAMIVKGTPNESYECVVRVCRKSIH